MAHTRFARLPVCAEVFDLGVIIPSLNDLEEGCT